MTDKPTKKEELEPFLGDIYPDAAEAFFFHPRSLADIKENCAIFLDTNVLLLPYQTSTNSLSAIKSVYERLTTENRLLIPSRAMQEFEKNVPLQLGNIFSSLANGLNFSAPKLNLPILENDHSYQALITELEKFQSSVRTYRTALNATLDTIREWNHNDPVRTLYREIFSSKQEAKITSITPENLKKVWDERRNKIIPPGYKDAAKSDAGIGDYLVWQAVLDSCAATNRDAILVSGEEKPDWWHQSAGRTLYIRREMMEEFRRATNGRTIRVISAADFFELYGANKETIEEIRKLPRALDIPSEHALSALQIEQFSGMAINLVQRFHITPSDFSCSSIGNMLLINVKDATPTTYNYVFAPANSKNDIPVVEDCVQLLSRELKDTYKALVVLVYPKDDLPKNYKSLKTLAPSEFIFTITFVDINGELSVYDMD